MERHRSLTACAGAAMICLSCSPSSGERQQSLATLHDSSVEPTDPPSDDPGEEGEPQDAGRSNDTGARADGGRDDCGGNGLCFDWPLPGTDAHDWVINNYVDLDPGPGIADWTGATGDDAKTLDGHLGVDIDVPTFRAMDGDVPVLAASGGVVVTATDGFEDRHVACMGEPNFVVLQHANGWTSSYLHMKRGSLVVKAGDVVGAGQKLGVVGSSGCSTAPHVHFEVRDAAGAVVDPFLVKAWRSPPAYATPLGVMDASLRASFFASVDDVKDPPPNVTNVTVGGDFGVGLSVAGGKAGDSITVLYHRPDGVVVLSPSVTFAQTYRHTYWYFNEPLGPEVGDWKIEILTNGALARSYVVTQSP